MRSDQSRILIGILAGIAAVVLVVTLINSSEPPKQLEDQAKKLPGQISDIRKTWNTQKKVFDGKLKSDEYEFMNSYSSAQTRADLFTQAKIKLNDADKLVNNTINPLVDDYDDAKQQQLQRAVDKATKLKDDANRLILRPNKWLDTVAKTRANSAKVVTDAQTAAASLKTDHGTLMGAVTSAKQAYPKQAAVLDKKFKWFTDLQTDATTALGNLQTEAAKTPPNSPNYAVMVQQADRIAVNRASFTKEDPKFRGAIASLGSSQTVTLVDIRVVRGVIVERLSWDTDADDPVTEHEYEYPAVPVDPETEAYFKKLKVGDFLANYGSEFGGDGESVPEIDPKQWKKLGIDQKWTEGFSDGFLSSDDSAEYFFGGFEDYTFCNKVRALKDGKPDTSERPAKKDNPYCQFDTQQDLANGIYWEESNTFDGAFMGMDLFAKGKGDFSEQATETASPPGIVYVDDPNMGEWQKDNDGNDIWIFYNPFFTNMIGGPYPYYYRSEWNTWNRGHRYEDQPYYAGTSSNPRFGGMSSQTASRFPGSNFNRSGLRDTTVRDAGRAGRGGGSGGGGK